MSVAELDTVIDRVMNDTAIASAVLGLRRRLHMLHLKYEDVATALQQQQLQQQRKRRRLKLQCLLRDCTIYFMLLSLEILLLKLLLF